MKLLYIPIITELKDGIIGLLLTLDGFIYSLISSSYKIFMALAGARLLTASAYQAIANKIYILVGVMMLFVLAYAILKAIVDPDQITKGDMAGSKILKNVVIAIIGLTFSPVIFNFLYQAQGLILENNVLGNLFFRSSDESNQVNLGSQTVGNSTVELGTVIPDNAIHESGGNIVATAVWQAFFYPSAGDEADMNEITASTKDYFLSSGLVAAGCAVAVTAAAVGLGIVTFGLGALLIGAAGGAACYAADKAIDNATAELIGDTMTLEEAYTYSSQTGDFEIYTGFVTEWEEGTIHYTFLISTIIGIFVFYAFISFSIDMGMRCAKLAYYQIIAPIPLILQVLPSFKQQFKNYISSVISTFLEVFIRITVVYVVVYIMCHINDMFSTEVFWTKLGFFEKMCARALLIIGLVLFAKQAPKLISETFGIKSGNMSLGIGKKLAEGGALGAGAVIGGSITSGVTKATRSWNKGTGKGYGFKRKLFNAGGSLVGGMISGGVTGAYGQITGKTASNFKEMKEAASKISADRNKKRDQRDLFNRVNSDAPDKVDKVVGKVTSTVKNWAVGPVDQSGWKNQEDTLDYLKETGDGALNIVKSHAISNAESLSSDLQAREPEQAAKHLLNGFENLYKMDADALSQLATLLGLNSNAKFKDVLNRVKNINEDDVESIIRQISKNRTILDGARNAANDYVKDVKASEVSAQMAAFEASGIPNDVSRYYESRLSDPKILKNLDTYSNLNINVDGRDIKLGDYVKEIFGESVLKNGTIDYNNILSKQGNNYSMEMKVNAEAQFVDKYGKPVDFSKMASHDDDSIRELAKALHDNGINSAEQAKASSIHVDGIVSSSGNVSYNVSFDSNDGTKHVIEGLTADQVHVFNIDKVTESKMVEGPSGEIVGSILKKLKDVAEREGDKVRKDEERIRAKQHATEQEVKQGDKK